MLVEGCFYLHNRYKNGKIVIEKRQGGGRFLAPVTSHVNMKTYGFGLCRREIKRNNELDNYGLNVAFSMNNGIINDSNETVFSEIMKI